MNNSWRERSTGWQRNPLMGLLAIAVIAGCVYLIVDWARGTQPVTYTNAYQCSSCNHTIELPLRPAVYPPLVCEKCGEETMYEQYRCACGHLFAWEAPRDPGVLDEDTLPEDEEERQKAIAEYEEQMKAYGGFDMPCPKCKGTDVYVEYTESHKRVMVENQKYISDHGKKELAKKYGIRF
jgi:hypothetical protein